MIAHRKPKNTPHTRTSQVSKKWVRTRTSQLATAHRNSQLAIAHRKSCLDGQDNKSIIFLIMIHDFRTIEAVHCLNMIWRLSKDLDLPEL